MGASRKTFSADEDALIRQQYVRHGAAWCVKQMPGRTTGSVTSRARRIGAARAKEDIHRPTSEMIDAVIRRAYTGERPVGFVSKCAKHVNRNRAWVAARALALGLIQSRDHREWTPEEIAFASARPLITPRALSVQMRRRGWQRTPSAIAHMRTEDRIQRTDDSRFTAASLAEAMGVRISTVTSWIGKGWLQAQPRGWERTEAQHGDGYLIHERAVAQFVVQHPGAISLTKIEPNKVWFIDLMARCAAPASTTGRQKRDTILQIAQARPDLSPESIAEMVDSTPNSVSSTISQAKAAERRQAAA